MNLSQEPVIRDFKNFKGDPDVVSHMEQMVKARADDYLQSVGQSMTVDELLSGTPDARANAIKLIQRTYDSILKECVSESILDSNPPMTFYKAAEASLTEQAVGVLSQNALDATRLLIELESVHQENPGLSAFETLTTDNRTREAHHELREVVASIESRLEQLQKLNATGAEVLRRQVFDTMLDHDWVKLASTQNKAAKASQKISVSFASGMKPGA